MAIANKLRLLKLTKKKELIFCKKKKLIFFVNLVTGQYQQLFRSISRSKKEIGKSCESLIEIYRDGLEIFNYCAVQCNVVAIN